MEGFKVGILNNLLNSVKEYESIGLNREQYEQLKDNSINTFNYNDIELTINQTLVSLGYTYTERTSKWLPKNNSQIVC